jgi:hypothetical protein
VSSNPPRTTAIASFAVALFFAVMIFVPGFLGIDGFDGGFAISFVSILIVAVAIIVGIMYLSWAAKLDRILRGEGIIAHWTYTPEFWAKYTEKEYKEEISEKKGLFIIISVIALGCGFFFLAIDPETGLFVFAVMLVLIGLCAFAWRFSAWNNHRQNVGGVREAFISKDAIYMNKKFYTWKAFLTSFDGVSIEKTRGMSMLVFKYTNVNKAGAQTYVTRVPIPPGQEEEAKSILEQFNVPPPPLPF